MDNRKKYLLVIVSGDAGGGDAHSGLTLEEVMNTLGGRAGQVCRDSIAGLALGESFSRMTLLNHAVTVVCTHVPALEDGAASIHIALSKGEITVSHGSDGDLLMRGLAPEGSWQKLFDLFDEIGLERVTGSE